MVKAEAPAHKAAKKLWVAFVLGNRADNRCGAFSTSGKPSNMRCREVSKSCEGLFTAENPIPDAIETSYVSSDIALSQCTVSPQRPNGFSGELVRVALRLRDAIAFFRQPHVGELFCSVTKMRVSFADITQVTDFDFLVFGEDSFALVIPRYYSRCFCCEAAR